MKKLLFVVLTIILIAAGVVSVAEEATVRALPLPVKVLLLPKFLQTFFDFLDIVRCAE